MFFLASRGYRCIAHDRRGHGRSSQPWDGNDMDTYADDLAALVEALDLQRRDPRRPLDRRRRSRALHRPPRHEARRQGGADRRRAAAHAQDRRPIPAALPIEVFDGIRAGVLADRSQFFKDSERAVLRLQPRRAPRCRRACATRSGCRACRRGLKAAYDCIKAFSETDFTEDLKKFDVPTLILHGDDDQIVPIDDGPAEREGCEAAWYRGAHGMCST